MPKYSKSQEKYLDLNRQINALDIKIFDKILDPLLVKVGLV